MLGKTPTLVPFFDFKENIRGFGGYLVFEGYLSLESMNSMQK